MVKKTKSRSFLSSTKTETTGTGSFSNSISFTTLTTKTSNYIDDEPSLFKLPNGDVFEGELIELESKGKEKFFKAQGPGIYTSTNGDKFAGFWDKGKLCESIPVTVMFTDGSLFEGNLKEWKYSGAAKYKYCDGTVLRCKFFENVPKTDLELTDPNGFLWTGKPKKSWGIFEAINHYYSSLESKLPA